MSIPACSGFSYTSADGKHFLGRTYDMFGTLEANRITVLAPGYELALSPSGNGGSVRLSNGLVGNAIQGPSFHIFTDAVNGHGLMATLQNFPLCAHYDTQKGEGHRDVHPAFFIPYILGRCASVSEVVEEVARINLTAEPIFSSPMSVHYLVSDGTGEAIIVEPDEGGISVHRNTIGVMTNAPGYQWQCANLRNYVAVSNVHTPPRQLLGQTIAPFGQGTGGSFGLPGSYSSPDRFVRLAFAKDFAVEVPGEIETVSRMYDIFSTVHVPAGMLRSSADSQDYEATLCTSVMCAESRTYYFSPAEDRRISAYRLDRALEAMPEGTFVSCYDIPDREDVDYVV